MATGAERPHDGTGGCLEPERAAWIALALTPGVGDERLAALLARFGSAAAVLEAPASALREVPGVGAALAAAIRGSSPADAGPVVGGTVALTLPGAPAGWWTLTTALDPDEFRLDDTRVVVVRVAPVARVKWD